MAASSAADSRTVTALPTPPLKAQARLLRTLFSAPHAALDELKAECGPVCGLGAGPLRMAIVGDAQVIADLLAQPVDRFRWGHRFNVLGFVVGFGSMIVSDGEDHKRRRGAVQAAFSRRRLNELVPLILDRTDAAIDALVAEHGPEPTEVNLTPIVRLLVLDIVVRALFGEAFAARAEEIGGLFERPQAYLEQPAFRQIPHPFPATLRAKVRADRRAIDVIVDEAIAAARVDTQDRSSGLVATLVAADELTDDEIRDQIVTLIGAGYDTTAASLSWLLWCATTSPGVWDELRAEADAVMGTAAVTAETHHEDMRRALTVADGVMRETLRLHPAGAIAPREAAVDVTAAGYEIKRGTMILWSAHLAGRDADAWPDPLRFDHRRFEALDHRQRALADASWVPFGRGARNCIGFALAQMELTLIIARLAQRLDVVAGRDTLPAPVGMVVNRPAGGAPMRVSPR